MAETPYAVEVANLNSTSNLSAYTSSTGTPSANKRLYAIVQISEASSVDPEITDANVSGWSLTWTRVSSLLYDNDSVTHRLFIFSADTGGSSPGSGSFTTGTIPNGAATGCQMSIIEVSYYDTGEPHETTNIVTAPASPNTAASSGAPSMSAFGDSLNRYLVVYGLDGAATVTADDSGTVEIFNNTHATPNQRMAVLLGPPGDSSPSATFSASTIWGAIALELKAGTTPADYPDIAEEDTAVTAEAANGTSHTISLPSNLASGDLLMIAACADASMDFTSLPGGWTSLYEDTTNSKVWVLYKTAAGSEGASVSISTSASEMVSAVAVRVKDGTWDGTPEITASAETTSATPDPASLSPSWGSAKTLWLAGFGADDNSPPATLYYPTSGYDPVGLAYSSNTVEGASVGLAQRRNEAASEDPGAFALGASHVHKAFTIAVEPAAAAPAGSKPKTLMILGVG